MEHHEEAAAAGDPARSAEIQALLDELRSLLADAVMQAEAAAEEQTRLERRLKLLEGPPQGGGTPINRHQGEPPQGDLPG
jgi:hypothetical protein